MHHTGYALHRSKEHRPEHRRAAARITLAETLPPRDSVDGAVARLLLAESRDPSHPTYAEATSLTGMQWMKRVLQNRLDHDPAQFLAPGARTLIEIIRAPGQFAGFERYPSYDDRLALRLQAILTIANDHRDPRRPTYAVFVRNGIAVARAAPVRDPALAAGSKWLGLFAWRTPGSDPPGRHFLKFAELAGNSFFAIPASPSPPPEWRSADPATKGMDRPGSHARGRRRVAWLRKSALE